MIFRSFEASKNIEAKKYENAQDLSFKNESVLKKLSLQKTGFSRNYFSENLLIKNKSFPEMSIFKKSDFQIKTFFLFSFI